MITEKGPRLLQEASRGLCHQPFVEPVGLAATDEAPGGVANDVQAGVVHGVEQPLRHLLLVLAVADVDGADDHLELLQHAVAVVAALAQAVLAQHTLPLRPEPGDRLRNSLYLRLDQQTRIEANPPQGATGLVWARRAAGSWLSDSVDDSSSLSLICRASEKISSCTTERSPSAMACISKLSVNSAVPTPRKMRTIVPSISRTHKVTTSPGSYIGPLFQIRNA